MKPRVHKKLSCRSVEFNLTEHCNLSCYACDHASPLLPEKFASLKSFSRDLKALARVLHSKQFRVVGGEPLLHPQLLEFLAEARLIGVADDIVVITNGVLLHRMSEKFFASIDQLWVAIYPGVKRRVDWAECSRLCAAHGVKLRIDHIKEFNRTVINDKIEDAKLVKKIFNDCAMVGELGCPTVHEGRFYACSVAPFMAPRLAQRGVAFDNRRTDGVALHGNASLYDDVERGLKGREPLAACSYCLGSSGPMAAHHQLDRKGKAAWLQEDNRAEILEAASRLRR